MIDFGNGDDRLTFQEAHSEDIGVKTLNQDERGMLINQQFVFFCGLRFNCILIHLFLLST